MNTKKIALTGRAITDSLIAETHVHKLADGSKLSVNLFQ